MSRVRAGLRLLAVLSAALAVSIVPVVRAYADMLSAPSSAAAMAPARKAATPAQRAHRVPRLRKSKRSLSVLPSRSSTRSAAGLSSRRGVPDRERRARAPSFAALPDHPPA